MPAPSPRPRDPADVMVRAILVAVVAAVPAAALSLTALSILQELARGGTWGEGWTAARWTDAEDLEMVPAAAAGALFLAFFAAVAAAGAWLLVTRRAAGRQDGATGVRSPGRPWAARSAAVLAAMAVPLLPLVGANWPLALAAALPAGLVVLLAEPWVTRTVVRGERPSTSTTTPSPGSGR